MEAESNNSQASSSKNGLLDERRIWVGNLDPRLSEYQLLKLLQKCGQIEKFDMLFHKGGPLIGQSRGYAFVTFSKTDSALNALEKLNGTVVANRPVAVRLAKNVIYDDLDKQKNRIDIPALGCQREGKYSKEEAIRAIEAKLKTLERSSDSDLEFNSNVAGGGQPVPFIQRYQFNKDRDNIGSTGHRSSLRAHSKPSSRPYNRSQRPHRR